MSTIQIGYDADGNTLDYASFALFSAACGVDPSLPSLLGSILNIEVWYADASQGTHFDESFNMYSFENNGFYVTVTGMYGDFIDRSCPTINQILSTIGTGANRCPIKFENLALGIDKTEIAFTSTTVANRRYLNPHFIRCNILGGLWNDYHTFIINECFMLTNGGQLNIGIYAGDLLVISSIIIQESINSNALRGNYSINIYNSTIYSNGTGIVHPPTDTKINNTIMYTKNTSNDTSVNYIYRETTQYNNSCFYQTEYPTKFSLDSSFDDFFGMGVDSCAKNSIIADPKFANTSGNMNTLADFALQSDSPCRYDNRTEENNPLYPANKLELTTIGAWSYFEPDYPEVENVLNTDTVNNVPGRWHKADKTKYPEGETFGLDGTSEEGELMLPANRDVRYNTNFGLTGLGTCRVPQAVNVRETVPVDDTIGTLHVPNVSPDDVREGVDY